MLTVRTHSDLIPELIYVIDGTQSRRDGQVVAKANTKCRKIWRTTSKARPPIAEIRAALDAFTGDSGYRLV